MNNWLFIVLLLALPTFTVAQSDSSILVNAIIIGNDTVPNITLDEIEVLLIKYPRTKRGRRKLSRYIKNVKKVLPYAKLAAQKLHKYEKLLLAAETEKEQKRLMKQAEKEIKEEYTDDIENMTFSQGLILIKLIDRETGETSFALLQELRGKFTAFFYQAFARLWGFNLKVSYDPEGEDRQLEAIVRLIEIGKL